MALVRRKTYKSVRDNVAYIESIDAEEGPSDILPEMPTGRRESVEDSVQMYLREIGEVSLLTAADEVALAQDIARGVAAQKLLEEQHHNIGSERFALN
ncbi:MAG: sigma-70 factor domain-containing protein, partial [Chloroflexota bacterium]